MNAKARVFSVIWTDCDTREKTRMWHVEFRDTCGCNVEEYFPNFNVASRYAMHVASGGNRWEFVS